MHVTKINLLEPNIDEFFPISMEEINKNFNQISEKQISPEKALGGCALGGCLVLLGGCLVLLVVYGLLTDSGKDTVQVESPEATGDK